MLSLGTSEKAPKGRDPANICTEVAPSAFSRAAPFLKEGFLPLIFFFEVEWSLASVLQLHMLYQLNQETHQLDGPPPINFFSWRPRGL